jgi:hypothetical protein
MPFKWKRTWPRIYASKGTPFAEELEEIVGLGGRGYLATGSFRISAGNSFKLPRT